MLLPGTPPQVCVVVCGKAVRSISVSNLSTCPRSDGSTEINRAANPATCGAAMLVPLREPYPPPGKLELTPTPGADTSGFRRLLLSTVTGPRLLKLAMLSLLVVAPTANDAS